MRTLLEISVRFLLDEFSGRGDGSEPEWPPSPLRLFQALVNSAARLGLEKFAPSLEQLEKLPPPVITATKPASIQPRYGATFYVPNNDGDLWFWQAEQGRWKTGGEELPPHAPPRVRSHSLPLGSC